MSDRYDVEISPALTVHLKKTNLPTALDEIIDAYVEGWSRVEVANHLRRRANILAPSKIPVGTQVPAWSPIPARRPPGVFGAEPGVLWNSPVTSDNRKDFFGVTPPKPKAIDRVTSSLQPLWTREYVWKDAEDDFWEFQAQTGKWHTLNKQDGYRPQIFGIDYPKTSHTFRRQESTKSHAQSPGTRTFRDVI